MPAFSVILTINRVAVYGGMLSGGVIATIYRTGSGIFIPSIGVAIAAVVFHLERTYIDNTDIGPQRS